MTSRTARDAERLLDEGGRLRSARRIVVVLGDQLTADAPAFEGFDDERDVILMMEVREEAEHVPSHKQRTVLFLSAMRHFALEQIERGRKIRYIRLDARGNTQSFASEIERAARTLRPEEIVFTHPGEHRVMGMAESLEERLGVPVRIEPDAHFLTDLDDFRAWAGGKKSLLMETFYRRQRKRLGVLMDGDGEPEGGKWNYDHENRESFKETPRVRPPYRARPDEVTKAVMDLVGRTWPDAYGRLEGFGWPVTRAEAKRALADFIEHRLATFGPFEDAMWTGAPFLHHALLSPALNLKLLDPRECVEAALAAYRAGRAPLNSVEGFIRQIIGWREFIRGVYWLEGPGYAERNYLGQHGGLPAFYWTGETDMRCMRECLASVLDHAYSHHIPRLMVLGNFALIAGVHPRAISDWFLAMYADAVDWATLPNVLGMAMHADGERDGRGRTVKRPVVGTKPYAGAANYINKMSNFCAHCPYDRSDRTGEGACPFNAFYWDFLLRNERRFAGDSRMALIMKNAARLGEGERRAIRRRAGRLRERFGVGLTVSAREGSDG